MLDIHAVATQSYSVGWLCQRIGALSCLLAASLFDTCWLGHLQIARKNFFFIFSVAF